jgi:integrase
MAPQYRKGKPSPWVVQHRVKMLNSAGRLISKVKTASFRTKELAAAYENSTHDASNARKHGIANPHEQTLFLDFSRDFLKRQRMRTDYTLASFTADESKIRNYWLEYLGPHPMKSITTADIIERLEWLQIEKGLSPATRNRHRALLHSMFQDALMRQKVLFNPVSAIPLLPESRTKKRVDLSDERQFEALLLALKQEGIEYWVIGTIMGFTGARICTANAVQFRDIDFNKGVIMFRRIEERAGGSKIVDRLKGKDQIDDEQDIHVVPLLPRLAEAVKYQIEHGAYTRPTDFVAANPVTGGYIPYDTLKDVFKRAITKAKLPPITSHAVRRFFATQLKRKGFTRSEIRELGGWSSDQVVARYDIKDVQHLSEKLKTLGFGGHDNVVRLKRGAK